MSARQEGLLDKIREELREINHKISDSGSWDRFIIIVLLIMITVNTCEG